MELPPLSPPPPPSAPPSPSSNHWDRWSEEEWARFKVDAAASSAEPSAGRVAVPASENRYAVQPLSVPYDASKSSEREVKRPRHQWVTKMSERLAEAGGASRAAHGPGGRSWAAASSQYDRSAQHAPPAHHQIRGVEALGEGVPAAVAKELGAAKTALAITDPAFHPERFTYVVMGRPCQVSSTSTMCLPCQSFRRLFSCLSNLFFVFGFTENLFFLRCEATGTGIELGWWMQVVTQNSVAPFAGSFDHEAPPSLSPTVDVG